MCRSINKRSLLAVQAWYYYIFHMAMQKVIVWIPTVMISKWKCSVFLSLYLKTQKYIQLTQKINLRYVLWPLVESVPFQQTHYQLSLKQGWTLQSENSNFKMIISRDKHTISFLSLSTYIYIHISTFSFWKRGKNPIIYTTSTTSHHIIGMTKHHKHWTPCELQSTILLLRKRDGLKRPRPTLKQTTKTGNATEH